MAVIDLHRLACKAPLGFGKFELLLAEFVAATTEPRPDKFDAHSAAPNNRALPEWSPPPATACDWLIKVGICVTKPTFASDEQLLAARMLAPPPLAVVEVRLRAFGCCFSFEVCLLAAAADEGAANWPPAIDE